MKWFPGDPSNTFGDQFYLKNARKLRFLVFFHFYARKRFTWVLGDSTPNCLCSVMSLSEQTYKCYKL